jgi:hypothetical protein
LPNDKIQENPITADRGGQVEREAKYQKTDIKDAKKIIADTLKQTRLIGERYTGELTVGFSDGGVIFIRKSETIK